MAAAEGQVYRLRRVGKAASRPDVRDVFRLPSTPKALQIGRNPAEADVFIDSKVHTALISRRHAEIRITQDGQGDSVYDITDRSVNGTYVNDIRLKPRTYHRLQEGDTVTFGHLKAGTVQPGQRAVQAGSEFKFKFEKCRTPADDVDSRTDSETPTLSQLEKSGDMERGNGRQLFPSVPSPDVLQDISNWVQKSKQVHTDPAEGGGQMETGTATSSSTGLSQFSVEDEDNDSDSEIFSIAATLQIPSDSDSDSDIFSPTKKPRTSDDKSLENVRSDSESPRAVSMATAVPMATSPSPIIKPREVPDSKVSSTVSNTKRKRRPTAGKTAAPVKRGRSVKPKQSGDREDWGPCDSFDCSRPEGDMLSWVQCDQCQAWYHVVCAGCDYDTVRQETAAFNCGCL
ncbi:transcription factor 19-like [Branchiostoma lanceolatum]|uniref:transcription factor 19-like n=1 Tax=Branchiostoma lanceolatum TaxID=7740 RepID=UPI003456C667